MLITLPNAVEKAVTNMAIDAAMLTSIPEGIATFRHYGWLESAATFGYAQTYEAVRKFIGKDLVICRRLSGGGIVDHRNDWTYAITIHATVPCVQIPATKLYENVHRAILLALGSFDIKAYLSTCPKSCATPKIEVPLLSQCFISPSANDVLRPDGRKIAGAAMKRGRNGLLIQGSIDRGSLPDKFDYTTFQAQLIDQLSKTLNLPNTIFNDIKSASFIQHLEEEKNRFSSEKWNRQR